MALQTEDGKSVDVESANLDFARAMTSTPKDDEPIAPAPPKVAPKDPPKTPAKRAPKARTQSKTVAGPVSDAVKSKRAKAGADILHTAAVITASLHTATGEEAWLKDTELFAATAPSFGEAMANVAAHNPAFARYLDSEDSGAIAAYLGLGIVSAQITMAVIDNHNARGKIPLFVEGLKLKVRAFLGRNRNANAKSAR